MATRLLKEIQAERFLHLIKSTIHVLKIIIDNFCRDLLKTQVRKYGSPIKPTVNETPGG